MTKTKKRNYIDKGIELINGKEIEWYKIENDINGNPRYVIHFSDLGIKTEDYGKIKGLKKYRAKWFGGGYVFQSHSIGFDLTVWLKYVDHYYKTKK